VIKGSNQCKSRILVNGSTLLVGGGIQVGVTFIEYAFNIYRDDFEFLFIVAKPLYDNLPPNIQLESNVISFKVSPSSIFRGRSIRREIKRLERNFDPDIIYSIGFPSYIMFKAPEIGRYTNPWEINSPPLPWHTIENSKKLKIFLGIQYRLLWARNAEYYETQTEAAKAGIIRKLGVDSSKVMVIPNSPNPIFVNHESFSVFTKVHKVKIFCLSAAYKHKNLEIIPFVASHLRVKFNIDAEFILTIPDGSPIAKNVEEKAKQLNVTDMICNIGKINLETCLEWYKKSNLVFLPSLLEVFSATYVEAFSMKRPIVTTDLDFARDVCGDAAVYFNSGSSEDAANRIAELCHNSELQLEMVKRGSERLGVFPNPFEKHKLSFQWLNEISQLERKNKY
jgi:glycosyltransferase involved in cell wall biosynthesis